MMLLSEALLPADITLVTARDEGAALLRASY